MVKQIPAGYKQTKVGVIPEDWDVVKLNEIASIQRGRFSPRPRNDPQYYGGEYPFVQTNDVVNSKGKITTYSQTLNEKGLKVSKLFPQGTILMTIAANIGFTGILIRDMTCPDSLVGIQCKKGLYNQFLNFYFISNQKRIDYLAEEAAQKNINLSTLNTFHIPLPLLKEQKKIAEILSTWDDAIAKQEQLIEQKQVFKKGIMQQIFSQKLRFKDDNGNDYPAWDYLELADLLTYEQPTKYQVNSTEYCDDYQTPVLTAGKSFILGYTNETNGIFRENLPVIIFDDFTTSNQFVNFKFKVKSSAIKILLPASDKVSIKYIYERMQFIDFALGDEHKRYWISEYSREVIEVPSSEEQNKIADFLTSLDDEITKQTYVLAQLKLQKQSLMQKLLTGQIRTYNFSKEIA